MIQQLLSQPIVLGIAFFIFVLFGVLFALVFDMQRKWKGVFGGKTKMKQDAALQALSRVALTEDRIAVLESKTEIVMSYNRFCDIRNVDLKGIRLRN